MSYIRATHFDSSITRSLCHHFLYCCPFVRRAVGGRAVSPNLHRRSEDLHGCRRIRFLGSVSVHPLTLFLLQHLHRRFQHLVCVRSIVSKSTDLSFDSRNDDLVVRSFVWLSYLCCFTQINLDLCSNSIIHVNCY
jgi:hypothetical protein